MNGNNFLIVIFTISIFLGRVLPDIVVLHSNQSHLKYQVSHILGGNVLSSVAIAHSASVSPVLDWAMRKSKVPQK